MMAKNNDAGSLIEAVGAMSSCPNPFDSGDAVITPRILASASLPYRAPRPEQLKDGCWIRTNGNYTLVVQGLQNGIPYGMYPRIFLIWLCDEVHRTKSRTISAGGSFLDFTRKLNIDSSRGKRGSGRLMIEQIEKTLDARFAFSMRSSSEGSLHSRRDFLSVSDGSDLFWNERAPGQGSLFESQITLTEKFFNEVMENFVPQDMRAINAIRARQSPLELDILLWLTYRMYCLQRSSRAALVTWEQLFVQFGCGFSRQRDFRAAFTSALKAVCALYQAARLAVDEEGLMLLPSKPMVPAKGYVQGGLI